MASLFGDSVRAERVTSAVTLPRDRALFFPVPRAVFDAPRHTLIRFGILDDSKDEQAHWNDKILYSFLVNLLQDPAVSRFTQDVYYTTKPLDGSSGDYVIFVAALHGRNTAQIAQRYVADLAGRRTS